jgi:hypothetical protein
MQTFYLAKTAEEKVKALLDAAQFSGVRLWKDSGVIRTSTRLVYSSWISAAISGMRDLVLEAIPEKEPVTRIMTLVRNMETFE